MDSKQFQNLAGSLHLMSSPDPIHCGLLLCSLHSRTLSEPSAHEENFLSSLAFGNVTELACSDGAVHFQVVFVHCTESSINPTQDFSFSVN